MENTRKIFFHIGLHKTGSTYLQEVIFPHLQISSVSSLVGRQIENFGGELFGNRLLISEENLSACPYAGRPPVPRELPWIQRYENGLHNLAMLFPDAYIILGVREHKGWLLSLYKQYLHQGGTETLQHFFDIGDGFQGLIRPSDLYLQPRIEMLNKLFSRRVFVYDSKDLIKKRAMVIEALCQFMNEPVPAVNWEAEKTQSNKGVEHYQANLLRWLNYIDRIRFLKRTWSVSRMVCQKLLSDWPKRKLQLPENLRQYVDENYADDWSYVSECCQRARFMR